MARAARFPASPPVREGPLGLRVDRDASLLAARRDALPVVVFPLESTIVDLDVDGASHRLDRSAFALVPARATHRIAARAPALRIVTLLVGPAAIAAAVREYRPHVDPAGFAPIFDAPRVVSRTRWVDELVHRYLFERDVCEKHDSHAARFLETELTKELFFLGREHMHERTRLSVVHAGDELARRAREWLEAHLFDAVRVADVARHVHASESTLLRAFRREYETTPLAYLLERRLDEAMLLLESHRYTVGEVASRVGYVSLPAFTVAFRKRFGVLPSRVREPPRARIAPPHGATPLVRRTRDKV